MHTCCHCGKLSEIADLIAVPENKTTRKQWAEDYELDLSNLEPKHNFICREHIYGADEPETADADDDAFAAFQMEVKEELDEEINPESLWRETKEEPMEEETSYDEFPFEPEQESFSVASFDATKYEETCEPTTSSSPSCSSAHSSTSLTDNQLMALCVKFSTNVSGVTNVECGMCANTFFDLSDTLMIRRHMLSKHPKTIDLMLHPNVPRKREFVANPPKLCEPMSEETRVFADKALCRFLVANGIPLSRARDRNLESLAFNMNSEYVIPTTETLDAYLREIAACKEQVITDRISGPVTVTFDTTTFNNTHYLAFTIIYYIPRNGIKQSLYLQELETEKPTATSIITAINQILDKSEGSARITTVVSGKAEYEEALEGMRCFNNVMICFSQNIHKFADSLIDHPVFSNPLETLRTFIKTFPTNRVLWSKFKAFIVKRRTYGEFPESDEGPWWTTLDFLTKCLHMHRLFAEFAAMNEELHYIGVDDNVNMVYLHSLLNLCKATLKSLVDVNGTIADVIPAIAEINASIGITTSRNEVVGVVVELFNQLLLPFVEQSDLHRYAIFLHPHTHGTPLLSTSEWNLIKQSISKQLLIREAATDRYVTTLRDTVTVDREVGEYSMYVSRTKPESISITDWWMRNSKKYPRLAKFAKELFQIPAFAVDADFYLGDYGLLTHSLQETEATKRKTLLLASSELVELRTKGNIAHKPICVKRKRDPACPEDAWYAPVDMRALFASEFTDKMEAPRQWPLPQTAPPVQSRQTVIPRMKPNAPQPKTRFPVGSVKLQKPRYQRERPTVLTLKQEIEKLGVKLEPKEPRKYTVASVQPPPRPAIVARSPFLQHQQGVSVPVTTKRYYAVRTVPAPTATTIKPVVRPTTLRQGTVTASAKITPKYTLPPAIPRIRTVPAGTPAAQGTKKVYFVRKPQPSK